MAVKNENQENNIMRKLKKTERMAIGYTLEKTIFYNKKNL